MKRFKLNDKYYKLIDGFEVNESSREVKYSNVKIDFTGKGISDLPLKYQECQLVDGDFRHIDADEGNRIEGTSFQVNQREEKLSELEYVKGQTSQNGTPTPSSPIPINITTGRQLVSVCAKNYLDLSIFSVASSFYTINDNNIQVIAGDNRGYTSIDKFLTLPSGTYTFMSKTQIPRLQITNRDTGVVLINQYAKYVQSFTLDNTTNIVIKILGATGTTFPFTIEKPMILKGTYVSYSEDYEEYKGNDYEINLGKNLFKTPVNATSNGITLTNNSDGSITLNGTATANASFTSTTGLNIPTGTYTLSYTSNQTIANEKIQLATRTSGGTRQVWRWVNQTSGNSTSTTTGVIDYIQILVMSGTALNNYNIKIQLEKGSLTSYSPYKTPIYLGKIGNYQDYIFRNTTENPLYDSNLEEGQWYIHKEIGRVVLNGSEYGWFKSGTNSFNSYGISSNNTGLPTITSDSLCSHFAYATYNRNNSYWFGNNNLYLVFPSSSDVNTLALFKTWLGNNQPILYYVLNTPTNTLIEDEELINQLNSIELLDGLNNVSVSSPYLSGIIGLHYNYQIEHDIEEVNEVIYTGYVNNYTLPKMKNKLEYRELDIDLLSPLAIATLRTADAVGTYNLKDLIREIIQPLIDDGFTLKELNVGNNQISVNYLTETIESSLNKLSNKFNFWWYIDKNKNIYINDINYIFSKGSKMIYNDNNKINGLIDFTPKMESIDYCNTLDYTNVRLFTLSTLTKVLTSDGINVIYEDYYYNPLIIKDTISPGEEITFDIPFVINTDRRGMSNTQLNIIENYFQLYKIASVSGDVIQLEEVVKLNYDENNNVIVPNNATISDSFNEDAEFVFVRDSFFDNLIVGFKYNGNSTIQIGDMSSQTGLIWSKVRINDNKEIEINKDIVSKTGIIEKQVDMNEQWLTYEELLDISHSLIRKNDVNVENIEIETDIENDFNVGDIINVNKPSFLTYGDFIITDKKRRYEDNVDSWIFELKNTNILESYIDLFRSSEQEEKSDKVFNLMTGDYSEEGIKEGYEVEVL